MERRPDAAPRQHSEQNPRVTLSIPGSSPPAEIRDVERSAARGATADALFRARFDQSSLPQAIADLDLHLIMVNDAMTALVGCSRLELLGQHVDSLAHPSDPGSRASEMLTPGSPGTLEYERVYRRPDGSTVPVRLFGSLVRDETGAPQSFAAFVVDLTDQRTAEAALRHGERLFQALLERASDIAVVCSPDGWISYANATVAHFGYRPEDLLDHRGFDFVHPDDRGAVEDAFDHVQAHPEAAVSLVYRHHHAAGGFRWVESCFANKLEDPEIGGIVVNLRDVTARVEAAKALQESEVRYRAIVETAQEGIWLTDPQGRTLYVNPKMIELLGRTSDELYATTPVELVDPEDAATMAKRLSGRRDAGAQSYDLRYTHPDGGLRWLKVCSSPLSNPDGEFVGALGMVSDVTELRATEQALRRQVLYDQLTGLPNRTLLQDRLEQAMDRRARGVASTVTVMVLDVDEFKLVNNSLGHAAGDRLIVEIAARLQSMARPGETVARSGGDEFVVLSEDLTASKASEFARRILSQLDPPFQIEGRAVHVTASVGIAVSPDCPSGELLQAADAAMYVAKHRGRGQVQVFDNTHATQTRDRLDLSVDLRAALDEDLLELHYQPIIELSSGRLLALEALARWNHPQRGPVSPEEFVSIAEQSGFVQHLDRWVLSTATADLADLRAKSHVGADVYVSVNVSALHLTQGDLEGAVADALARSGLPHRCLGLEVTETAVMMDHEAASSLLSRIVDLGVSIALDDFGTGYSSLAYLKRLPVARLKIDRTFVENLPNSPDDLAIVASVLHLSKAVGVQVIAEGVETAEQLDLLARLDCHSAQGYYWSRPVSKARLISLLEDEAQFDVRALDHEDVPMRPPSAVLATHEHGLNRLLFLHQTGASLRTVAAALNSEGYRTPLGTRWHPTSVAAVVADYAYPSLWTRG